MNQLTKLIALVLVIGSLVACKSDEQKQIKAVDNARDRVTDIKADLVVKEDQVAKAKVDLNQARIDYIQAADARLEALDTRILQSKTNALTDQAMLASLRGEAVALRTQAADETRPLAPDARNMFQQVIDRIETELARK